MSHKIVTYHPDVSLHNAPSVQVTVQVDEEGKPSKQVQLFATDADGRAICKMEVNPDWNGFGTKGVDDLRATGEIDFAALKAFVDREVGKAQSGDLKGTLAGRLEQVSELEKRAHEALKTTREAEEKLAESTHKDTELTRVLTDKTAQLETTLALIAARQAEASLLAQSLEDTITLVEQARQELDAVRSETTGQKDIMVGPPVQYEVGDRVYRAGDAKRNIGVVSLVERTPGGKIYHVSWTGGPAPKGTHRYKELYPEGYTPPETQPEEG